jgi:hypothetical protein
VVARVESLNLGSEAPNSRQAVDDAADLEVVRGTSRRINVFDARVYSSIPSSEEQHAILRNREWQAAMASVEPIGL